MRKLIIMIVLAAALCMAADITGTWNATVEIQGNTGTPTFKIVQAGELLTGTYSGQLGESPLTGTIRGEKVEFSFEVHGQITGRVTYVGTVSGNKMSGKASFADMGEGTWEATKK